MVKVGFIVEGKGDKILLNSDRFKKFLFHRYKVNYEDGDIIYSGGKSFVKTNLKSFLQNLHKKGTEFIFILIDQDDKRNLKKRRKYNPPDCPPLIVEEIKNYRDNNHYIKENQIFVVMVREMEAWFLADSNLGFDCKGQEPENIYDPSEVVAKQIGTKSHALIAKKIAPDFSLKRAAERAPSARRFLEKLQMISDKYNIPKEEIIKPEKNTPA